MDNRQDSENHEYSRNSPNSIAGVALQSRTSRGLSKTLTDMNPQELLSETSEHLEVSQNGKAGVAVARPTDVAVMSVIKDNMLRSANPVRNR